PHYPSANCWTGFGVVGPMARTVRDAALLLSVMAGPDERDPRSLPDTGEDFVSATEGDIHGLRAAWSADLGYAAVDPEVRSLCAAAAKVFENLGCVVEEAHPGFEDPEPLFLDLTAPLRAAVCGPYLAQWRDQMDPILVKRIARTQGTTAVEYEQATQRRTTLWHIVRRFFERYEVLLTPTTAVPPFAIGMDFPPESPGRTVFSPGLDSIHVSIRHHWATSYFGTVWVDAGGVARGASDCRSAFCRCDGAQNREPV